MLRAYLVRGLKTGLVAGLVLGLFVALLANPMIAAVEGLAGEHADAGAGESHDHGAHDQGAHDGGHAAGDHGVVSATTASAVGVLSAVFWGLLLGVGAFGLVYYFLEPAIPGSTAVQSALVAAGGFLAVSGVPWLAFPPQPPGVEPALSIEVRLVLYGTLVVAGLAACLAGGYACERLKTRSRGWALVGGLAPMGVLAAVALLAPVPPVEHSLSASLVTAFRAQIVFGQVLVWTALAATHAWLCRRDAGDAPDPATSVATAPRTAD